MVALVASGSLPIPPIFDPLGLVRLASRRKYGAVGHWDCALGTLTTSSDDGPFIPRVRDSVGRLQADVVSILLGCRSLCFDQLDRFEPVELI
jgi:hypothetical protein